ncbi:MAG: hypothetical protein JST42_21795 [Bacteroidetes bacterium]|nr:hypothetical protein [Bacteroidota bacterium]
MGLFSFLRNKPTTTASFPLDQTTGHRIYPIIKPADDSRILASRFTSNPVITRDLAPGIVITYGLDTSHGFETITTSHCKQFRISDQDLATLSARNLLNRTDGRINIEKMDFSSSIPEAEPFYRVRLDNDLDSSVMLVDDFWKQAATMLRTDLIAVTLPAKNTLYFADYHSIFSFRLMRPFSGRMYEASKQDRIEISPNTYVRKNNRWILFDDTEKQHTQLTMGLN